VTAGPDNPRPRVLVVDDDRPTRTLLARFLEVEGFAVDEAADGHQALELAAGARPDLVVLDISMPAPDGLDVLTTLRRQGDIPVILLSARGAEADRLLGLKLGADDYVVKPFSAPELAARIRSVLRRSVPAGPSRRLEFGDLVVDLAAREVRVGERKVETTAREFDLLAFLATSPRQVFTRGQLLAHVWGSSQDWQDPDTVTEHVSRLRKKIEERPDRPRWLCTVRGVGYRFEP
jgi:two-component system, OmpR family, phosphate regulon response regulator PhoB